MFFLLFFLFFFLHLPSISYSTRFKSPQSNQSNPLYQPIQQSGIVTHQTLIIHPFTHPTHLYPLITFLCPLTHLLTPTHPPTYLHPPTHSPTHLLTPTHPPTYLHPPTHPPTYTHPPTHPPTYLHPLTHPPTYTHPPTHLLTPTHPLTLGILRPSMLHMTAWFTPILCRFPYTALSRSLLASFTTRHPVFFIS